LFYLRITLHYNKNIGLAGYVKKSLEAEKLQFLSSAKTRELLPNLDKRKAAFELLAQAAFLLSIVLLRCDYN
jgi:hypothetical protein